MAWPTRASSSSTPGKTTWDVAFEESVAGLSIGLAAATAVGDVIQATAALESAIPNIEIPASVLSFIATSRSGSDTTAASFHGWPPSCAHEKNALRCPRMRTRNLLSLGLASLWAIACGPTVAEPPPALPPAASSAPVIPPPQVPEPHLTELRQLTFGGENAEAYWAFGGKELTLQSRTGDQKCDRIYRMALPTSDARPELVPVSSGKGATTCSYFFPGDHEMLFASTHLGGDECPPKPDHSMGYVWPIYTSYDIFKANPDGSNLRRLTETPGYDAEGTVCTKDGSIIFTSVRDGDLDLYRMDADGKNVRRLTNYPGYDGGAFFNSDCTKIVWRASRPKGKALEEYKQLLGKALVRPTKLELWVANADGSDARQITYLDAASFAPFFHPSSRRVLFSSNYGDPKGREFDIWAVNVDGTDLERITDTPGFDGFPMFSPDGSLLAFSSNRGDAEGSHDTNVFLAHWDEGNRRPKVETAADRVGGEITWLADPAREGRGLGTKGLAASGAHIEKRMQELKLTPAGDAGSFRQRFAVTTKLSVGAKTKLVLGEKPIASGDFAVLGYSPFHVAAKGDLVLAGYGVVAKELGIDEYKKLDVKGKVVLVRRFLPENPKLATPAASRLHGDIRRKAWLAKEHGAVALIVVDAPARPGAKPPEEAKLPELEPEGFGDAGIPVAVVKRDAAAGTLADLARGKKIEAEVTTDLTAVSSDAFNVVGRIVAAPADGKKLPGVIVIGAHYDHLGRGGRNSLAPGNTEFHLGADDNASGTAALLEVARELSGKKSELRRDVIIASFSGEESGVLGSSHFVRARAEGKKGAIDPADVYAMLNFDMVGRLRENQLQVLGTDSAKEWKALVPPACDAVRIECALAADGGVGPSDQMSFYLAGAPVLHFFSGTHADYHKPSDTSDKINAAGAAQVAKLGAGLCATLSARAEPLSYQKNFTGPPTRGDMRGGGASLGTVPDYAGPGPGKTGVLLAGVRPGGPAEKAGMKRGDILIRIGTRAVSSVEDLMYVLGSSKAGQKAKAVVIRDGKEVKLDITFGASHRH